MKQKALVSGQAVSASGGRIEKEHSEAASRWITVLWCLLGLLLPRASICGLYAPLGMGVAAAAGGRRIPEVGLCVIIGYLLAGSAADALLYAVAVTVAAGVRWIAEALPALRHRRWIPPLTGGFSTLLAGLLLQRGETLTLIDAALLFTNALLAAGFGTACVLAAHTLTRPEVTARGRLALGIVAAAVFAAGGTVTVGDVAPGRILTLTAVMVIACAGREGDSVAFGAACGLFTVLIAPEQTPAALTLVAVGLLSGAYVRFGRVAQALVTAAISTLFHAIGGDGEALLFGVYEALAAGILLLIVPLSWEAGLRQWLCRQEESHVAAAWRLQWHNRLDLASRTLFEMAQTVEAVSEKLTGLSGPGLGDVYAGLADTACRHCPKRMVCWNHRYNDTLDALNHLTPHLREQGQIDELSLAEGFPGCPLRDRIAQHINEGYRAYRVREGAYARLAELRRGVTGQFEEVSGLLAQWALKAQDSATMDIDMARRVREVCSGLGLSSEVTCCRQKNGGLTIQLWLTEPPSIDRDELRQALSDICGQTLSEPVIFHTTGRTYVTLGPAPTFRVHIGTAQWSCGGQALCGDAVEQLADESGRVIAILSDGMGCGGRAAVDGTMCAALTARLLATGFEAESTLRLVNTALMVRAGEESLSTLDILEIDVHTGALVSRKAGAAASLLRSRGRVSRIEQTSLPVGILREVRFAEYRDRLTHGDVVLMVSDGIYLGGSSWVEELLAASPADRPPRELAQTIVAEARRRAPDGREDDMTAMVLQIEEISKTGTNA